MKKNPIKFKRLSINSLKVSLMLLMVSFFANNITAQFFDQLSNPKVDVKIEHPPGLGIKIDKVAFNSISGKCADEVVDLLISDFVNNEVEVIDRSNLNAILNEHDLNASGYVDKNKAVSIGKIIGPSALISLKVLRCKTEIKDNLYSTEKKYNSKTKSYYTVKAYISRTTVYLKASIQTTDLTTGRIFASRVLEYSPSFDNKSYDGWPEAPSEYEVQERAFEYLTYDVHKMFFPWTESTDLYFFNDRKGDLKKAFKMLKAGDIDESFELSKTNLDNCKNSSGTKEKTLAHAYYNLGMMYFIQNDYDNAIENFTEARKLRPGDIVTEALNECDRAKALTEEMQRVDEKAALEIEKNEEQSRQDEQTQKDNTLTNSTIISLTEKKLPTNLIIQKIKTSNCNFDTSTEALLELTDAGVIEEIIILMMNQE